MARSTNGFKKASMNKYYACSYAAFAVSAIGFIATAYLIKKGLKKA
jgi:hypothetical protein